MPEQHEGGVTLPEQKYGKSRKEKVEEFAPQQIVKEIRDLLDAQAEGKISLEEFRNKVEEKIETLDYNLERLGR